MKSRILIFTLFIAIHGFAQKVNHSNIPELVKITLVNSYPNATAVQWEKEENNFEVGFESEKKKYSILFDLNGEIRETEIEISIDALPIKARDYINQHYKNHRIKETCQIVDANGKLIYEAEIRGTDLLFDADGNLISTIFKK
jgi:hypothetical protein